jgi:hypothetical protein
MKPSGEFKSHKVYALVYPRSGRVFYVGISAQSLRLRLTQHLSETRAGHGGQRKYRIIKRLLDKGKRPNIVELDRCEPKDWEAKEREWIARFRRAGYKLTNAADGGLGQFGRTHSPQVKAKIAEGVSRARAKSKLSVDTLD